MIPGLERSPAEGKGYPLHLFWPGEFSGLYSSWGCKELDRTERLSLCFTLCLLLLLLIVMICMLRSTGKIIYHCPCAVCSVMSYSAALWILARQAPLSMDFSRQEHWSLLPFPSPGDLPAQESTLCLFCLLHWQAGSLLLVPPRGVMIQGSLI